MKDSLFFPLVKGMPVCCATLMLHIHRRPSQGMVRQQRDTAADDTQPGTGSRHRNVQPAVFELKTQQG